MGRMDFPLTELGKTSRGAGVRGMAHPGLIHTYQVELPSSHLDICVWSTGEWLQCKRSLYSQTHFFLVLTTKSGYFQMRLYLNDMTELAVSSITVF